jgi:hypothetical protein
MATCFAPSPRQPTEPVPHDNAAALAQLGREHAIELAFDAEGVCTVLLDEDAVLRLEGDPQGSRLRISATVGRLPNSRSAHALRVLLQANFQGQGTGAASLGLDHVSDEVVLGCEVAVDELGPRGLEPTLEAFAVRLSYWRENLLRLTSEPSPRHGPARSLDLRA